jgi:AraC-like DNA-binding protein
VKATKTKYVYTMGSHASLKRKLATERATHMSKKMTPERAVRTIVKELEAKGRADARAVKSHVRAGSYAEALRWKAWAEASAYDSRYVARRFRELMGITVVLALAFLTACGVPELASLDGGGLADATYPDGSTPLDATLDAPDALDAAPSPDVSLDGGVDAGTDLLVSGDAGVTDATTACADTWPLRSGAIELYGCALPPDNVCTSSPTVPTADVQACEAALRGATGCGDIDVPACWYVDPSAPLDGGDCIHGTPTSVCLDPSDCREHRGAGFVCLPCCP